MVKCKHVETVLDGTCYVCSECGLVLEDERFVSNFPRVYGDDKDNKKRHEILDPLGIRRTVIRVGKKELGAGIKSTFQRIVKADRWYNYTAGVKAQSTKILMTSFLTNNGINKNILKTINYYILKTKTINLQGNSMECYTSALLIYIFRECKIPFGVKKITSYFNVRNASVFRLLGRIIKKYKLPNLPPLQLRDYIVYYVNRVNNICGFDGNMLMMIQKKCLKSMEKLKDINICGRNKLCDTAGIIYYVSKNNKLGITQDVISDILSVSSVSLRNVYKRIKGVK